MFPRASTPDLSRSKKRMREKMTNTQSDKFLLVNKVSAAGKLSSARKLLLACALNALLAPLLLFAQGSTAAATATLASIGGRVTDTQGAGVAGAIVTLYARAPRLQRLTAVADAGGAYRFESLAVAAAVEPCANSRSGASKALSAQASNNLRAKDNLPAAETLLVSKILSNRELVIFSRILFLERRRPGAEPRGT
jgi:hypothetical protein